MWILSMVKSWPLYPRYYFLQSIEISLGIFILVLWRIVLVKFEAEGKIFEITRTIHSNSKRSEQFLIKFIYSEKATTFFKIFTLLLSYVLPVKNKVKIPQNFVAFSENNDCFFTCVLFSVKLIYIFWEGNKNFQNLHLTFVLCSASQK